MAEWSDPRSAAALGTQAGARGAAYDAGLRSYMLSVYNYMASGVLLTGLVAMLFAAGDGNSYAAQVFLAGGPLAWIIKLAPLGFVLVLSFGGMRLSQPVTQALFWAFAVSMGLSLSYIFLVYTQASIAGAFFSSAAGFLALSLYGYTTKRDLTAFGAFLIVGLVGLIVAMLLNTFLFQSGEMGLVISIVGVLLFAGLTAYDTQKVKWMYDEVAGTEYQGRVAIQGALTLYLDFINMFLFILRLFGSSRD
jgi:FtsH-binding integral membrane protein